MQDVKLTGLFLIAILVMGCTASWNKIVTEYNGDKLTVSGNLTDTNRIVLKINGKTVIKDWIFMSKDYVLQRTQSQSRLLSRTGN